MKEHMPPLQGLYYFYLAAEKGSFKDAAEAVFVTPAAISQQIRQLEEWLNCPLFVRQHRTISLTREGEILYFSAKSGFKEITQGLQKLSKDPEPNRLSISTHPSFAQHWLVPRVNQFREKHPDISLLLDPRNELITFDDNTIDLCIRYGKGNYPGLHSELLVEEELLPACHPRYQDEHNIFSVADLARADLIEDIWPDMDWSRWLSHMGVEPNAPALKYNGSNFVLEGALAGQGVALVKKNLTRRYIEEGKLVRIGDKAIKSDYSYYLCAPAHYFKREKVALFSHWIRSQISPQPA